MPPSFQKRIELYTSIRNNEDGLKVWLMVIITSSTSMAINKNDFDVLHGKRITKLWRRTFLIEMRPLTNHVNLRSCTFQQSKWPQ